MIPQVDLFSFDFWKKSTTQKTVLKLTDLSSSLQGIFSQTVTLICSPLYHNRRLMITYRRNNRQAYLALKVLWLKIIHKFVRIVENISPCPLLPRVKSGILLVLYLEVCSTLPFKKSFCYAPQKLKMQLWSLVPGRNFSLREKLLLC